MKLVALFALVTALLALRHNGLRALKYYKIAPASWYSCITFEERFAAVYHTCVAAISVGVLIG